MVLVPACALAGLVGFSMPGCAGAPERAPGAIDELERPPADFTLDVVILTGSRVPDRLEAQFRPGHFILLADGSLLHDSGRSVTWDQRPGRTRALYQQQVSDLWRLAKQLGFTNPASADFTGNPQLVEPERNDTVYLISFAAEGERWTFVRPFEHESDADPASVTLIRALADLAWSPDLPTDRFAPVRYDFGPDPWAGFRRRGEP